MASCNECIHGYVCDSYWQGEGHMPNLCTQEDLPGYICENFKDKSRYIELPCDIGDKVYFIKAFFEFAKQPMCGTVCMIKTFTGIKSWTFGAIMDENSRERHFVSNDIGETVFLTYEEAENKLKEREDERA